MMKFIKILAVMIALFSGQVAKATLILDSASSNVYNIFITNGVTFLSPVTITNNLFLSNVVEGVIINNSNLVSLGDNDWAFTNGAVRPNLSRDIAPFSSNATDLGTADYPFRVIRGTTIVGSTIRVDRIYMNADSIEFNPSVLVDVGQFSYNPTNQTFTTASNRAPYISFTVEASEAGNPLLPRRFAFADVTQQLSRASFPSVAPMVLRGYRYTARTSTNGTLVIDSALFLAAVTNANDVTTNNFIVKPAVMQDYVLSVISSNPVDTTRYATSALNTNVFPGSGAYYGAALMKDGRVFFVPSAATAARIWNPANDVVTVLTNVFAGAGNLRGATTLPDGRIFMAPYAQGGIKIYNPDTGAIHSPSNFGVAWPSSGYGVPIPLEDGRIFLPPINVNVVAPAKIYDPVSDITTTLTSVPTPSSAMFSGACMMQDGRVYMVPGSVNPSGLAWIYDPIADSAVAAGGNYSVGYNYGAPSLLPDGRIVTGSSNNNQFRIYDPVLNSLATVIMAAGVVLDSLLLPDGRVLFYPPATANTQVRIYNPADDSILYITNGIANSMGGTAVLIRDGRVVQAPFNATTGWRVYTDTYTNNFNLPYLMTPERMH